MRGPVRAIVAAFAAAAVAAGVARAGAQTLPRIHITALGMHADRTAVAPGDIYHLTIHVHITERRDRLDELQLPALTNATDLGDERRRVESPGGGTDFYEIMTVSSPDAGVAEFTPAYIDAIDPASGRALRYSSQPLSVRVTGAPVPIDRVTREVGDAFRTLGLLAAGVVALALLAGVVLVRRRPGRARTAAPPPPAAPASRPTLPPVDPLRHAIAAFRARGDDASLDALRNLLFVRAGAASGATLADALRVLGDAQPALARTMAIAERVRFGPASERAAATRDLLVALDTLLATNPTRHPEPAPCHPEPVEG